MEYLKRKYPEHSDRIQGRAAEAPVTNGIFCETDLDNIDNMDTMSEINTEATGFSRGGRLRASMPVIRPTVNMTKERPLGLVYLQYKNETKRGLMPNEVTGLDTVRALYVRAFPKQLTMEMLEQPSRKIYIRDPSTEIFYELEHVNEIQDRTVLKIYEPGFVEDPNAPGPSSPRSTTSTPVELDYYSEPEVDHQKRDVRKNRYNTMTLPRNMHFMQEGEGARPAPAAGNLNPSPEKMQSQSMENFRRGVPERSSATLQRPAAHTQAFQRLTPERATLSGPVTRGPGGPGGPHAQSPYGRRGQPHPNQPHPQQQHGATMPRRMPPPSQHEGGVGPGMGPRPQGGSATMPRPHQRGGPAMVDGGSRPGSRPSSGDIVSRSQNSTPVTKAMQNQVMSAPMPNGHPRQRGPPPQHLQQTPPGRPQGATLPRNGAPGMRHPIPNGMGPQHRGQPPLRRHGSHDGTFSHGSERITAMEQQIANLAGMVRSVIGTHNGTPRQQGRPPQDAVQRPPDRPAPPMRTDSAPVQARTPTPQQQQQQQQQISRTPTPQQQTRPPGPQSPRPSSHPGTSVTGRPGTHPGGVNIQRSAMVLKHRTTDLRMQLKQIRKMHLNMVQQMNNNFRSTSHKIRMALEGAPGTDNHPIRNQRARVHQEYIKYMQTQEMIDRDLRILDENVDKLREKTINNRGSVDMDRLEQQAQLLGNCSRGIAEQKVNFPVLSEKLKAVQEGEMEIVVREENWMKHEPQRLDDHFKRCKKITSTLYTLKRMAATNEEPYIISPSSPTNAPSTAPSITPTITPTVTTTRQVVRVESAPLPTSLEAKRETVESDQEPIVHHDLPQRFKSPVERDEFEHTLSGKREELRRTNNMEANQTRQKRFLRELFDQENHDSMTPIITPEKAAKREAQKEAAGGQKKGPPPPPPPRKHFPASPASPEQINKKISWSSSKTTSQPKVKSPPPVAAKPSSAKKSIKTTTTTVTTQSYQLADVNQALDDLESLMVKATDTADMDDSNIIQERHLTHPSYKQSLLYSTPSSPNGTIQKPVHAHIRLPQSPSRSFATKPKPLSPKGESAKVGGKTSAFKPIKKASSPTTNSSVASLSISLSQPSKAPKSSPTANKSGKSQESTKPQNENISSERSEASPKSADEKQAVTIVVTDTEGDMTQTATRDTKLGEKDGEIKDSGESKESEHPEADMNTSQGKTSPMKTNLKSSTPQSNITNGNSDTSKPNHKDEKVCETNGGNVDVEKEVVKSADKGDSSKSDYVPEIKTTFVNGIIEETFIN